MATFLRRFQVGLVFLAFALLIYGGLWLGTRRIGHDTWLYIYSWRAFISDALANGIFPFWDSFSSPGVPSGDLASGAYYPIALLFGLLPHYAPSTLVLEIIFTGLISLTGMYGWLRGQGVSVPLSVAGALALAGAAPLLNTTAVFSVQITMSLTPWVFWAVDLLIDHAARWHLGAVILATVIWLMISGGYIGLSYVVFLWAGLYGVVRLFLRPTHAIQAVRGALFAGLLAGALLFLPLSEYIVTFVSQLSALRAVTGFTSPADSYTGHLVWPALLTLALPSGGYLPRMMAGYGQLYIGVVMLTSLAAGLATVRLQRLEAFLLVCGGVILLAAMGPVSPVATFFVNYIPGFAMFRWHAFHAGVAVLLLIAVSTRLLDRFLAQGVDVPRLRYRFVAVALTTFGLLALATVVVMASSGFEATALLVFTRYDYVILAASALFAGGLLIVVWRWACTAETGTERVPRPVYRFAIVLILALVGLRAALFLWPPAAAVNLLQAAGGTAEQIELAIQHGLLALPAVMDGQRGPIPAAQLLIWDLLQSGTVLLAFAWLILKGPGGQRQRLMWVVVGLVACDMALAAHRYSQGNLYWITSAQSLSPIVRPASVVYTENVRDGAISRKSPYDWKTDQGYENQALQRRHPTFFSHGPVADPRIMALMTGPGGLDVFKYLLWRLPAGADATMATWGQVASVPDYERLRLQPNELDVRVNSPDPLRLVWTDAAGAGWQVRVNGQPAQLVTVLGALKAVDLPAGASDVVFIYQPVYLVPGLGLLGLGLAGLGWLAWRALRRNP